MSSISASLFVVIHELQKEVGKYQTILEECVESENYGKAAYIHGLIKGMEDVINKISGAIKEEANSPDK